jgi:hypothetical protein
MATKTLKTDFGQFIFLDDQTVVAEAYDSVSIEGKKVQDAMDLIENELPGDYTLILDRKADYSIVPVEVYKFFARLERLKAIAIVRYRDRDFLPDNMEQRVFKGRIEKFSSIKEAHEWSLNII